MATVSFSLNQRTADSVVITWTPLTNGDLGQALDLPAYADRSVQVEGTFGAGGTCVVQGSNDGSNYRTLLDPQGAALSFTAAGVKQVQEITRYIRPNITGGDGTTSLTAVSTLRK